MVNFLVMGEIRSGAWSVASLLNTHPNVVCHDQVINHPSAAKRVRAHYMYFGNDATTRPYGYATYETGPPSPVYPHPYYSTERDPFYIELDPLLSNYVEKTLFTSTVNGETHAGTRLDTSLIDKQSLDDTIRRWCVANTAAVIYLDRNPFDCYVSYKAAARFNRWSSPHERVQLPITLDVQECNEYVHRTLARRDRLLRLLTTSTADLCVLQYRWLFQREELLGILADYLRLDGKQFGITENAAMYPYPMKERVNNYTELRTKCSSTVREMMDISAHEDEIFFANQKKKRKVQ